MKNTTVSYKRIICSVILGIATAFILFYVFLPAINLQSPGFWIYLAAVMFAFSIPFYGINIEKRTHEAENGRFTFFRSSRRVSKPKSKLSIVLIILTILPFAIILMGQIFSSTVFFAKSYANVITVQESVFEEDLPETKEITNIALMDSASATKLGNKTLGSLSDVVSQYDVTDSYTQINYQGAPKKVANLEYVDFFKWIGNNSNGIPGMVMVDPVKSNAEYIKLKTPMYYVDSAYFNQDLERKLRFSYPTKIFNSICFEVDDNGNPYYIVSCARPQVSLFGALDIEEVIVFNPCDGSSVIYDINNVPTWIDIVYTGDLATEKYNWHGTLSGGFFNSIIGNKGCKQTTDDFGYIALEDDVWYFTGVTSVSGDQSNIGFILSNARTGEYKFYPVIGAEEHSAMAAAAGEVQEKGYVASFPSLVNISGQPTYIMVLKDAAGLVKLYALVNVENYSLVATGATQAEAMSSYKKLLTQNNINIGETDETTTITVENIRIAMVADVSTLYITDTNGDVYKGYLEADESLILIRIGDTIELKYTESDVSRINLISSWKFATQGE